MAQTAKVIAARKKEIESYGFVYNENQMAYNLTSIGATILLNQVENWNKSEWENFGKSTVADIARLKPIPPSAGEEVQLQVASGKEIVPINKMELSTIKLTDIPFETLKPAFDLWETECLSLSVKDVNDKEGLKAVKAKKSIAVKTRTTVEKLFDTSKAVARVETNRLLASEKEYYAGLSKGEQHLVSELKKYDDWKEEDDRRKEEESKAELTRRVAVLKENGMVFTGSYYAIGPIMSMDLSTIQAMTTIEFDVFTGKVKMEKSRLDEIAEQDRQAEDLRKENERKEREEFNRKQQELADKQAEFDRKEKELADATERIRKQKITIRESQLMQVGLTFCARIPILGESGYYFKIGEVEQWVAMSAIEIMEDADFEGKIEYLKTTISDAKQKADAAAEQERIAKEQAKARQQQLIGLGLVWQQYLSAFTYARENAPTKCVVAIGEVTGQSMDRWEQTIADVKFTIESINQEQEEYDAAEKKKALEYHERQTDLINAGMQIVGPNFVRKNEFGVSTFITIDEVKAIDPDNWSRRLLEVQGEIEKVNQDADTKRAKILAAKEALKPEIQRVKEYINMLESTITPEVTDDNLAEILTNIDDAIVAALVKAKNDLQRIEK